MVETHPIQGMVIKSIPLYGENKENNILCQRYLLQKNPTKNRNKVALVAILSQILAHQAQEQAGIRRHRTHLRKVRMGRMLCLPLRHSSAHQLLILLLLMGPQPLFLRVWNQEGSQIFW